MTTGKSEDCDFRDRALIATAEAKLERGLSLEWNERLAFNFDIADKTAAHIIAEMNSFRETNNRAIQYTQGAASAGRLAIRLVMASVYALSARHSQKRQQLEAEVLELRKRIIDLEERSPEVAGTYDPVKIYNKFDQIALNGASFTAKRDNPGPCPGDGWQLSAAQGKAGKPGPRVKALTVDGEGMLKLINSDGSIVKCDLYSLLMKVKSA